MNLLRSKIVRQGAAFMASNDDDDNDDDDNSLMDNVQETASAVIWRFSGSRV